MSDNHRPDGWHIDRRPNGVWLEDWKGGRPAIRLHFTRDQFDRLAGAIVTDSWRDIDSPFRQLVECPE
jgi:hypothetical protein